MSHRQASDGQRGNGSESPEDFEKKVRASRVRGAIGCVLSVYLGNRFVMGWDLISDEGIGKMVHAFAHSDWPLVIAVPSYIFLNIVAGVVGYALVCNDPRTINPGC